MAGKQRTVSHRPRWPIRRWRTRGLVEALPAINRSLGSVGHVVAGIAAIAIAGAKSRAVPVHQGLTAWGLVIETTLALGASTRALEIGLTHFQGGRWITLSVESFLYYEVDGELLPIDQGAAEGLRIGDFKAGIPILFDGRLFHCDHIHAFVVVILTRAPWARAEFGALVDKAQRNLNSAG